MDAEAKTRITKIGDVVSEEGDDCLVVIYSADGRHFGHRYVLTDEGLQIGRGFENHIVLETDSVSRKHCRLERSGGEWVVTDMDSTNGTYVNDKPIRHHKLRRGDQIKIGDTIFKYLAGSDVESQYHETIYRMSIMDALTGAFNKRYFSDMLAREISRAARHRRPLSLMLIDLDHFKSINDTYGHLAGDFVLQLIVAELKTSLRPDDLLARYGGEEFVVILPETDRNGALELAERLRAQTEEMQVTFEGEAIRSRNSPGITASIGVAELDMGQSGEELLRTADKHLYDSKRAGRNRVSG